MYQNIFPVSIKQPQHSCSSIVHKYYTELLVSLDWVRRDKYLKVDDKNLCLSRSGIMETKIGTILYNILSRGVSLTGNFNYYDRARRVFSVPAETARGREDAHRGFQPSERP